MVFSELNACLIPISLFFASQYLSIGCKSNNRQVNKRVDTPKMGKIPATPGLNKTSQTPTSTTPEMSTGKGKDVEPKSMTNTDLNTNIFTVNLSVPSKEVDEKVEKVEKVEELKVVVVDEKKVVKAENTAKETGKSTKKKKSGERKKTDEETNIKKEGVKVDNKAKDAKKKKSGTFIEKTAIDQEPSNMNKVITAKTQILSEKSAIDHAQMNTAKVMLDENKLGQVSINNTQKTASIEGSHKKIGKDDELPLKSAIAQISINKTQMTTPAEGSHDEGKAKHEE